MAKAKFSLDSMFGNFNRSQSSDTAPSEEQAPLSAVVPTSPSSTSPVSRPAVTEEKQVLQGKLVKKGKTQKKEYNYGTKRTFPIPDELWDDALIIMQAKGLKQVEFIQGLIRDCVEANSEMIATVKKMRGEL